MEGFGEDLLIGKLESIEEEYEERTRLLADPEIVNDMERVQRIAKEQAELEDLVGKYREFKLACKGLEETQTMLNDGLDADMEEMVREEVERLRARRERLWEDIKVSLLPKDRNDDKDVIVEIRAAAGGDEAGLFAADLFRMYSRYAEDKRWRVDIVDRHESGIGGFKEIVFEVKGRGAYSRLKYESGVHRVQRVPATEAGGRTHTSTATVAVLPEVEEVEVVIKDSDLRVDTFCSSGAGGQNVNKVATAVRLTHLPSGMVVTCQDERSQLKNRMKALTVLRARLYHIEYEKRFQEVGLARRLQVGGGERAEKIRTYNFPQDRLTDHRVGLTWHNLAAILDGQLDAIADAVATADRAERLKEQLAV